jgi:hypothetical protein
LEEEKEKGDSEEMRKREEGIRREKEKRGRKKEGRKRSWQKLKDIRRQKWMRIKTKSSSLVTIQRDYTGEYTYQCWYPFEHNTRKFLILFSIDRVR